MKYRCLRNCFINGELYLKGEVHELPDSMVKSEKHFQPLGQPVEVEPEPIAEGVAEAWKAGAVAEPVKPDKIPAGMFWCPKCKILHRETSKIGQKHLKHKEEE